MKTRRARPRSKPPAEHSSSLADATRKSMSLRKNASKTKFNCSRRKTRRRRKSQKSTSVACSRANWALRTPLSKKSANCSS